MGFESILFVSDLFELLEYVGEAIDNWFPEPYFLLGLLRNYVHMTFSHLTYRLFLWLLILLALVGLLRLFGRLPVIP